MGCTSCGTGGCGTTGGCGKKGGCATGGCNKLNTYDWFNGMQSPTKTEFENVYEVRFKNTRKRFYKNVNGLTLITGDLVAVESDRGFDVGQISLGGILAQLQMKKKKSGRQADKVGKIYRHATKEDIGKLQKARAREQETLVRTRVIVRELDLDMKISDVEYQGDNTKAIFYYIADQRVDFRELIKALANEFRIRVEMKQIGLRHESGLIGGIGSCGRELCCSTWLTDFKSVSTAAARFQNLSLNPMKISGQCGRLKCCLNFELETYMDALEDIPKVERLETQLGKATRHKTDIFKRLMWFSYENENTWIPVSVDHVIEMAAMNKRGEKPSSLRALEPEPVINPEDNIDFVDVVGQSTLREEPKKRRNKKRKGNNNRKKSEARGGKGRSQSGGSEAGNRGGGNNRRRGKGGNQKPSGSGAKDNKGGNGPKPKGNASRGPKKGSGNGPKGQGAAPQKGPGGNKPKGKEGGNRSSSKGRNQGGGKKPGPQNKGAGNQSKPGNPNPK